MLGIGARPRQGDCLAERQVKARLDPLMAGRAIGDVQAIGIAEEEILLLRIIGRQIEHECSVIDRAAQTRLDAVEGLNLGLRNALLALQTVEIRRLRRALAP